MHAPLVCRRYHETHLAIRHAPLELAVGFVRTFGGVRYTLYEHADQVFVGLGSVWTLEIDGAGRMRCDGKAWQQPASFADALADAMGQIPIVDWRAYGRATFEFAYLTHGMTPSEDAGPLLTLAIPSAEIMLHGQELHLRCLDEGDLSRLTDQLRQLDEATDLVPAGKPVQPEDFGHAQTTYAANVADAVAEMSGHAYEKVILSRTVPIPETVDLPLSFHAGRARNTPPRAFLLRDGEFQAYGFSPETLLELDEGGRISTQPLAGTRALKGHPEEDRRLREDLLHDPKEIAEHAVSVRLAMEEMQPLCDPESLGVSEFMTVRPRGSVQHLSSRIRGHLCDGLGPWDAFLRLFPAVTASGIPKPAALDSIRRHEDSARGLYSGCVFTTNSLGAMDAALVLRSVYKRGPRCWLQAGAGVVPLSNPGRELEETCEKLASVSRYLRMA